MIVFGLNMLAQHDASACLVVDGRIVAYGEEERFSRRKKAARELPEAAARYCLRATGVRLDQVDAIALPFAVYGTPFHDEPPDPRNTFGVREGRVRDDRRLTQFLRGLAPGSTLPDRVFYVAHHLAHAASAYRLSGLDQTAVLVADAEGDHVSTTVAVGRGGELTAVRQWPVAQSLGSSTPPSPATSVSASTARARPWAWPRTAATTGASTRCSSSPRTGSPAPCRTWTECPSRCPPGCATSTRPTARPPGGGGSTTRPAPG